MEQLHHLCHWSVFADRLPITYNKMPDHYILCPICNVDNSRPFLKAGGYEIVKCQQCDPYFINPQPAFKELEALYGSYKLTSQWEHGDIYYNRKIVNLLLKLRSFGNILDVGCGNGQLLSFLKDRGFNVFGLEIVDREDYARDLKTAGIELFVGTVQELESQYKSRAPFDVDTHGLRPWH